jgi:hypothetical protein
MHPLRSIAVVALVATAASAQKPDAQKPAVSKITSVTVYQNTALVTREVTLPEAAGPVEVFVSPMPPATVPNSLYAEGTDAVRVLNTRFRSRAIAEAANAIAVSIGETTVPLSTDPLYLRDDRPTNLLRWDVKVDKGQNGEKVLTIAYDYKLELDKTVTIGSFLAK